MANITLANKEVEVSEDGFLVNTEDWTEDIARELAKEEKIELNDRHWVVINYMRKEYKDSGKSPTIRKINNNSGVSTKELYQIFPSRPGRTAARVAGVPKPQGCV